jgi:hypothetical protein
MVLSKKHNHTCQQPHRFFFKCFERNGFFTPEPVSKCLQPFQKHATTDLPNVTHDSR